MSLTVRRVVTGLDKSGRAVVAIDETVKRNHRTDSIDYVVIASGKSLRAEG